MSEEDKRKLAFIARMLYESKIGLEPTSEEIQALNNISEDWGWYDVSVDEFLN